MYDDLLYSKVVECKSSGYVVKTGDTVWSIARKFTGSGDDYVELKEKNPFIKDITKLVIGELLIIPDHWVKLQSFKIVKDRKSFGYEVTKTLFRKWVEFYRFNSPKAIKHYEKKKRLLTVEEAVRHMTVFDQHTTNVAIAWVLIRRFEGIFKIGFCGNRNTSVLNIADRYFPSVNSEGVTDITELNIDPLVQDIPFECVLEKCLEENEDSARLIVAFHNHFNIPHIQRLTDNIGF